MQEIFALMQTDVSAQFWTFISGVANLYIKVMGSDKFTNVWRSIPFKSDTIRIVCQFLNKEPKLPLSRS